MRNFIKTLLGACFVLCLAQTIAAATFTVTKIADTSDGACDADCSLREAIAAANASADSDTIEFSAAFFNTARTIVLSGTDLIITNNGTLIINGRGTNLLTVSGNNASRIFTNNTNATADINNLRVTGGNGVSTVSTGRGGGIYNNGGNLTLNNVIVNGNQAANGGGVSNAGTGTVTLINCTIFSNSATGAGGGMQNFFGNTANIAGSTFNGNTSASTSTGGGAIQANGTMNIANSTFVNNTANGGSGGAIFYNGQGIVLNNVTIANNTSTNGAGGFHKATTPDNAALRNTIVAGNSGGADSPDVTGLIGSLGNNLIGAVGSSTGWVASDILNQAAQLGATGNNGGPTLTFTLLFTSPAINAGNNCVVNQSCAAGNPFVPLVNDQRGAGFPRRQGAAVDIGAFEFETGTTAARAPFDFDGDARTDYAVFRPSTGTWFYRANAGNFTVQFGFGTDKLAPADYDGDGRTDIAVWREASFARFYILNSSTNTVRSEQFGTTGDDPSAVGDWDGDGRADPAVYRQFVGIPENPPPSSFYYRPSGSPGVDFLVVRWGASGDRPVTSDYDADGKIDAAVFRPANGVWYISQSSNNQPLYRQWGTASDVQVPADYDGDGKTDVAIWCNGLWAILQSSDNQQRYQQFGISSDRLAPGDYDGDGKTDLAVWRSGVFYVLRSNGNQAQGFQFGAVTDTPVASAFIRSTPAVIAD